MGKEILLTQIEQANTLDTLYPLWNELKTYLENQPSLLELGNLFGYQYHLSDKLNQLSLSFLQEKKYKESIAFHQELITYFKDDKYLFTDGTDQIKLEIKNRVWNGLNVGPQDKIRVYGKLDNEIFEKPELEVISVEKAQ